MSDRNICETFRSTRLSGGDLRPGLWLPPLGWGCGGADRRTWAVEPAGKTTQTKP